MPRPRLRGDPYWIALAGIALAVFVLGLLAYLAVRHHEFVTFEGERPSYDPKGLFVERVRVFDRVELNVAEEAERPKGDLVTSYLLFATASATFLGSLFAAATRAGRARWLFLLAAVGTAYLAVDEEFEVHETLGANLLFLQDVPGVRRPDDLVFALYAVPVLAFLVAFRSELTRSRRAAALLGAAVAGFAFAALADARDLRFENEVEAAAGVLLLAGFMALAVDLLVVARGSPRERT